MAAGSNTGFHSDDSLNYLMNRHAISFQSGAASSSSEMLPVGGYYSTGMMVPGNSSLVDTGSGIIQLGNSSGSSLSLDSVHGLNHDAGLAVEWSVEEQCKLDEGLAMFKDEPSIMKYIKIAATLPDKTVRDVALRCRWMQRKRRKPEDHCVGKKANNWKDKLVESSPKANMNSVLPQNVVGYSPDSSHNKHMLAEGIIPPVMHLLEQNAQALSRISSNLSVYKLQDNIDLFCNARDNITAILNDMSEMPGIMSQMPPLPVSVNEDLTNSIVARVNGSLLGTTQTVFGSPHGVQLKHEPSC